MYDYYRYCYEARERAETREREAEVERAARGRARRGRAHRRRAYLTARLARLRTTA
jgi:hypothetical protein